MPGESSIFLIICPDPEEGANLRARETERQPEGKGQLKTSVTPANGEIISKYVARLIGDDG